MTFLHAEMNPDVVGFFMEKKSGEGKSQYDGCFPPSHDLFIQRVKLKGKEIYVELLRRLDGTGGMLLLQSLVSPSGSWPFS